MVAVQLDGEPQPPFSFPSTLTSFPVLAKNKKIKKYIPTA